MNLKSEIVDNFLLNHSKKCYIKIVFQHQICDECKNILSKLKMNMFMNDCHFFHIIEHSYLSKSSFLIVEKKKTFKFMIKFFLNAKTVNFVVIICN